MDNKNTLIIAIPYSLFFFFLSLFGINRHHSNYFKNLFYFGDIFANALTGGHPEVTVSARVGKYSAYYGSRPGFTSWLWRVMRCFIDKSFYPMDGIGHCRQAYRWTESRIFNKDGIGGDTTIQHGSLVSVFFLFLITMLACCILLPMIALLSKRNLV